MKKTGEENWETRNNILALYESWWVLKDHDAGEKLPNPVRNWGEKPDKRSIDKKLPNRWGELGKKTERL